MAKLGPYFRRDDALCVVVDIAEGDQAEIGESSPEAEVLRFFARAGEEPAVVGDATGEETKGDAGEKDGRGGDGGEAKGEAKSEGDVKGGGEEGNSAVTAVDVSLTAEEKTQLKANFDSIDAGGSGSLDFATFKSAIALAFAEHPDKPKMPDEEALKKEFENVDTDGSGDIDLEVSLRGEGI